MCIGKLQFLSTEFSTSRYDQPVYISSYLKSSLLCRYMISLRNVSGCLPVLVSISLYTKESGCIIARLHFRTLLKPNISSDSDWPIQSAAVLPGFTLSLSSCQVHTVFLVGSARCLKKTLPQLRHMELKTLFFIN